MTKSKHSIERQPKRETKVYLDVQDFNRRLLKVFCGLKTLDEDEISEIANGLTPENSFYILEKEEFNHFWLELDQNSIRIVFWDVEDDHEVQSHRFSFDSLIEESLDSIWNEENRKSFIVGAKTLIKALTGAIQTAESIDVTK